MGAATAGRTSAHVSPPNCKRPCLTGGAVEADCQAEDDEREAKRGRRLTPHMVSHLERSFSAGPPKLETDRKLKLAAELDMTPRQVAIWFQNRRARCKGKQLEHNCITLRAKLEDLRAVYRAAVVERNRLIQLVKLLGGDSNSEEACGTGDPEGRRSLPLSEPPEAPFVEGDATVGARCDLQLQTSPASRVPWGGGLSAQSASASVACAVPNFLHRAPLAVPGVADSPPPVEVGRPCMDWQDASCADSLRVPIAPSPPVARDDTSIPEFDLAAGNGKIGRRYRRDVMVPGSYGTCGGRGIDSRTAITCVSSMSTLNSPSYSSSVSLDFRYHPPANSGLATDMWSGFQFESALHLSSTPPLPSTAAHVDDDLLHGVSHFQHDFSCDMLDDNHDRAATSLWEWLDSGGLTCAQLQER